MLFEIFNWIILFFSMAQQYLTGVQPATIQNNKDVTRVLIAKLNSVRRRSIGNGNPARAEIHEHLRTTLRENGWITHGKMPVIATIKNDHGDDKLEESIQNLLRGEEGWASDPARDHLRLADHPGFQWTILRPLKFRPEELYISALFNDD
jgi:hypothetical protein